MPIRMVSVQAGARSIALRVKAADTGERQAGGFQCATPEEIKRHLILFDFGRELVTHFHMQNVPAALDIAFVKEDGRIFAILKMDPSPTELYGPLGPFRYAVEAHAGLREPGIRQGEARLLLPPCTADTRALPDTHAPPQSRCASSAAAAFWLKAAVGSGPAASLARRATTAFAAGSCS